MFDVEVLFDRIKYCEQWEPRLPLAQESRLSGDGGKDRILGGGGKGGGTGGGGGSGDKNPKNVPVTNPNWKSASFSSYKNINKSIRDVLKGAKEEPPPPCPFDAGVEMCLAYHAKGQCNGMCKRAADHRAHTTEQDAKLIAWCQKHYK